MHLHTGAPESIHKERSISNVGELPPGYRERDPHQTNQHILSKTMKRDVGWDAGRGARMGAGIRGGWRAAGEYSRYHKGSHMVLAQLFPDQLKKKNRSPPSARAFTR